MGQLVPVMGSVITMSPLCVLWERALTFTVGEALRMPQARLYQESAKGGGLHNLQQKAREEGCDQDFPSPPQQPLLLYLSATYLGSRYSELLASFFFRIFLYIYFY